MIVQRWIVSTMAAGLLFGATALWQRSGRPFAHLATQAQGQTPDPTCFTPLWPQPISIANFRSSSISADNAFFVVVTSDKDTVTLRHQNGKKIWSIADPGATQARVAAGGETAISYAPLNPMRPTITIVSGAHAETVTSRKLDGAIWDVSISQDGKTAGVVTGNHSLYLFTLSPTLSCKQWSLDGAGNSITVNSKSQCVVAGTWDDSGIACYNFKGEALWKYPKDSGQRRSVMNRLFDAQISQDGQSVLGVSYSNIHHSDGVLYLWKRGGDGTPLWTYPLGGDASRLRARITTDGRFVALTYVQNIVQGDRTVEQRQLVLLDHNGKEYLRSGGPLFIRPSLVSVASDGSRIAVTMDQNTLYNVNSSGRLFPSKPLSSTILNTEPSPDGALLLVYSSDGSLNLVRSFR